MSEIHRLGQKLSLSSSVLRKAEEFERKAQSIRIAGPGVAAVCLQLAAADQKCPLDKTKLQLCMKSSGITAHGYKSLQSSLQEQLHLQQALSISELAIRFGCSDAVPKANSVIEHFLKSLSPAQRQFADCSRAVYSAAALTMACKLLNSAPDDKKRKGLRIDGNKLRAACGYMPKEFKKVLELLNKSEVAWEANAGRKKFMVKDTTVSPRKRKTADAPVGTVAPRKKSKAPKTNLGYSDWKAQILQQAEAQA